MSPEPKLIVTCPSCRGATIEIALESRWEAVLCGNCGHQLLISDGICQALPPEIECAAIKDAEKQGWDTLARDFPPEYYECLPYLEEHGFESGEYFTLAAREFRHVQAYLEPLAGKVGLDLGGSIGWATRRFKEAGCHMVLADYNDSSASGMGKAGIYFNKVGWFPRFRVDAEALPFADEQFDFVLSSSFLHHLTDIPRAVGEITRVLKPGGVYIAACEAYSSRLKTPAKYIVGEVRAYRELGINEQVFPEKHYREAFRRANLKTMIVNTRWDALSHGTHEYGIKLKEHGYRPEILTNRVARRGLQGAVARALLGTGAWRVAVPFLRNRLFHDFALSLTSRIGWRLA